MYATDAKATEIVAGVQVGHQSLERRGRVTLRCWDRVENCVEQRHQVGIRARHADAFHCPTLAGHCRNHRKVQVVVGVSEIQKQVFNIEQHFFGSRVAAIHLVDHQHYGQVGVQRL